MKKSKTKGILSYLPGVKGPQFKQGVVLALIRQALRNGDIATIAMRYKAFASCSKVLKTEQLRRFMSGRKKSERHQNFTAQLISEISRRRVFAPEERNQSSLFERALELGQKLGQKSNFLRYERSFCSYFHFYLRGALP